MGWTSISRQSTVDSQQSTEGENKFSVKGLTSKNGRKYNRHSYTDEFETFARSWANHPDRKSGEVTKHYDPKTNTNKIILSTGEGQFAVVGSEKSRNIHDQKEEAWGNVYLRDRERSNRYASSSGSKRSNPKGRSNNLSHAFYNGPNARTNDAVHGGKSERYKGRFDSQDNRTGKSGTDLSGSDLRAFKSAQLDLISASGENKDQYKYWLHTVKDIKTFEEALARDDTDLPEDFDIDRAMAAKKRGTVTVYSAGPIRDGAFVSPSKSEIEMFSDSKQIQQKTVKLTEVAWLDAIQGVYANTQEAETEMKHSLRLAEQMDKVRLSLGLEAQNSRLTQKIEDYQQIVRQQDAEIREMQREQSRAGVRIFADAGFFFLPAFFANPTFFSVPLDIFPPWDYNENRTEKEEFR